MDPYICCLLGICCNFGSPEQFEKLVSIRLMRGGCETRSHAETVVRFDLSLVQAMLEALKG